MIVVPHEEWFTIYGFQGDREGVATVAALCEYMQESAGNHAAVLGLSIDRLYGEGVAWVLARMQIELGNLPSINGRIRVKTWPVGVDGLQYRRDFIVYNEDDSVAARAITQWVVVNLATRRVGRVPAFIAKASLSNPATAMDEDNARLSLLEESGETCRFRARLADIDRNKHVNNVRYMDWILESTPESAREKGRLCRLDLSFKAESLHNDVISARVGASPQQESGRTVGFSHNLVRLSDGKELVRGRTLWHIHTA